MKLIYVLVIATLMACGADRTQAGDMSLDMTIDMSVGRDLTMCVYGEVHGQCTAPNAVVTGTCFESPVCVCVFPEALWVCCYAQNGGRDVGLHVGDPCCGPHSTNPFEPDYPCFCDETQHWTCPFDLGTSD